MSFNNKPRAIAYLLGAIAFATSQDAIVKALSGGYPTWETVAFRGATAIPPFLIWGYFARLNLFALPPAWRLILLRSVILFSAYMAFALAIATLPLANAVAMYFTMPFFVGGLAGWALGEKVPDYRWLAIALGFGGVLISCAPVAKVSRLPHCSHSIPHSAMRWANYSAERFHKALTRSSSPICKVCSISRARCSSDC